MFTEIVKKYGPWSISKVKTAKQCPRRFNWQAINKQPKEPVPQDPATRVGSAVHKTLELAIKGLPIENAMVAAADKLQLTLQEMQELRTQRDNMADFMRRLDAFKQKFGVRTQYVEKQFGITIDLEPSGFFDSNVFFRGVIDLGLVTSGNNFIIIDHKNSTRPYHEPEQLDGYALLISKALPSINGVQSAYHYVPLRDILWPGKLQTVAEIGTEVIPHFVNYMNEATVDIENEDDYRTGKHCKWCEFKNLCEQNRKRAPRKKTTPEIVM